jgi:hypothetical protein
LLNLSQLWQKVEWSSGMSRIIRTLFASRKGMIVATWMFSIRGIQAVCSGLMSCVTSLNLLPPMAFLEKLL